MYRILLFLLLLYSCVNANKPDVIQVSYKKTVTVTKVYELKFGSQSCMPCMEIIHSNLVGQEGIIEVCSFYEMNGEEETTKQIVARISLDSAATTIEDVIHSLEKETFLTVKSFHSKLDFYE